MSPIKTIIIVGGGTAGWMTAAALSRFLDNKNYKILLIESAQIGTVGVGEATVPHIRHFNNMLGIDEAEFIRAIQATYKLGIRFEHWGRLGESYIHPFGSHGYPLHSLAFHHYWIRLFNQGKVAPFDQFSMAVVAAQENRFQYPSDNLNSPLSTYTYAFHINASGYASFLHHYAEAKGVSRLEGKINCCVLDDSGAIDHLVLDSGESVGGDFFIDCSGFSGLLIEGALKTGYENWSQWLLCDSAVAVPCEAAQEPPLYTRAIARDFGWQWQIPLQHRVGNGYVYSSQYLNEESAYQALLANLPGKALASPNFLKFTPGRRLKSWSKNCVAIGLSSGFLEPLESTSIYLIQTAILKLLEYFPEEKNDPVKQNEFNRQIKNEYEKIRDFIILHYNLTSRDDSPFWRYCAAMELPPELARKKRLFYEAGHIEKYQNGLFMEPSWLAVYLGQAMPPQSYDARVDNYELTEIQTHLHAMAASLTDTSANMPLANLSLYTAIPQATTGQDAFLSLYGKAP